MDKAAAKMANTLSHVQNSGQIIAAESLVERFLSWKEAQEDFATAAAASIAANDSANKNTSLLALRNAQELVSHTTDKLEEIIDEYNKQKWPPGTRESQKKNGTVRPYFYVTNPADRIRLEQFRSYLEAYLRYVKKLTLPATARGIGPRTFRWTKRVSNKNGKTIARFEGNYRQNFAVRKIRKNGTLKLNAELKPIFKKNGTPELLPVDYISVADLKRLLIEILPDRTINKYKRQLGLAGANENTAAAAAASLFTEAEAEGGRRKTRKRRN